MSVYTYTKTYTDKVTVIGSGAYGCALANQLKNNNKCSVTIWSHNQKDCDKINIQHICPILGVPINTGIECTTSLEDAIKDSNYIVLATASKFIKSTCENMKDYYDGQEVIVASKGMDGNKVLTDVVKDILGISGNVWVMSGPAHAEQILRGEDTYLDYYGSEKFKKLVQSDHFKLFDCGDPIGMQVGGALKNILAIGVGFLEGTKVNSNTISVFKTFGWEEVVRIGEALGASRTTFSGLSGLGDFFTTADSLDSRNKRCGLKLAEGKSVEEVKVEMAPNEIEGLAAISSAIKVINDYNLDCPNITGLNSLLVDNETKVYDKKEKMIKSLRYFK